jgi:hypothetical protein
MGAGHGIIENDELRLEFAGSGERAAGVVFLADLVTVLLQKPPESTRGLGIIIDG